MEKEKVKHDWVSVGLSVIASIAVSGLVSVFANSYLEDRSEMTQRRILLYSEFLEDSKEWSSRVDELNLDLVEWMNKSEYWKSDSEYFNIKIDSELVSNIEDQRVELISKLAVLDIIASHEVSVSANKLRRIAWRMTTVWLTENYDHDTEILKIINAELNSNNPDTNSFVDLAFNDFSTNEFNNQLKDLQLKMRKDIHPSIFSGALDSILNRMGHMTCVQIFTWTHPVFCSNNH